MKIELTPQESEEYFHTALCNGLSQLMQYGIELQYKTVDYKAAKNKLKNPCYEDILIQIIKDGHSLTAGDIEETQDDVILTLSIVHERVSQTPQRHLFDMIQGNDDADTADVILQTVIYGEIIFG